MFQRNGGTTLGALGAIGHKAKQMELIKETRTGMWYDIGDYKALIVPIPTGKQTSRLWRNPQPRAALEPHLQLPFAGLDFDGIIFWYIQGCSKDNC